MVRDKTFFGVLGRALTIDSFSLGRQPFALPNELRQLNGENMF